MYFTNLLDTLFLSDHLLCLFSVMSTYLVNFTVAPILAHGISTLPIIPVDRGLYAMDNSALGGSFRPPRMTARANTQRQDRERKSRQAFLEAKREKSRWSINIPAYHKPKDARLINTSRNRCVEVHDDGSVRSTGLLNSLHGKLVR